MDKLGKVKLRRILSEEIGVPLRDVIDYGRYEYFGNKERIELGAHTIVALNGQVKIIEPDYTGENITYRTRIIKEVG